MAAHEPSLSAALVPWIAPLLSFAAVFVGAWLVSANDRRKRQLEFVDKQLRDLYSPALSVRKEIRALSELRVRIDSVADRTWREQVQQQAPHIPDHEPYERIIQFSNEQMKDVLLPRYKNMFDVLRTNFYLANESTRQHLPALIEYIELWDRYFNKTISPPVIANLEVNEDKLQLLYDDIENTFRSLRRTLASGNLISASRFPFNLLIWRE